MNPETRGEVDVFIVKRASWSNRGAHSTIELHRLRGVATERTVRFADRSLAVGCRVVVAREEVAFSADEAVTRYINAELAEVERLRGQLAQALARIDAARTLTVDEPVAIVKVEP